MSEFNLKIATGNAAFSGDDHGAEIARILRLVAQRIEYAGSLPEGMDGTVSDLNGNHCGYWTAEARDPEYLEF